MHTIQALKFKTVQTLWQTIFVFYFLPIHLYKPWEEKYDRKRKIQIRINFTIKFIIERRKISKRNSAIKKHCKNNWIKKWKIQLSTKEIRCGYIKNEVTEN